MPSQHGGKREGNTTMHVHGGINGLSVTLGEPFDFYALDADEGVLTTDHAASSRGLPVFVYKGRAFGPADLQALAIPGTAPAHAITVGRSTVTDEELQGIRAAGYTVRLLTTDDSAIGYRADVLSPLTPTTTRG